MRELIVIAALYLTLIAQAAAAPLFPVGAATAIVGLPCLGVLALYGGRRPAMIAIPAYAVGEAWLRGLEPVLLLASYLPLLLLLDGLASRQLLLAPGPRLASAVALTGLWMRLLEAFRAISAGAEPEALALVVRSLLPGAALDLLLVAAVYGTFRLLTGEPVESTRRRRPVYSL